MHSNGKGPAACLGDFTQVNTLPAMAQCKDSRMKGSSPSLPRNADVLSGPLTGCVLQPVLAADCGSLAISQVKKAC